MLGAGDRVPDANVWAAAGEGPLPLREALAGPGLALVCFYPFDWSPTCTSELRLLRERGGELADAGIRPFGISQDSPWSQRAFAESIGVVGAVTLLSDRLGEATEAFGVAATSNGLPKAERSAFLVAGATVVAAWHLGTELPDVDAIVASASPFSG